MKVNAEKLAAALRTIAADADAGVERTAKARAAEAGINENTWYWYAANGRLRLPTVEEMKAAAAAWAEHHDYVQAAGAVAMDVNDYIARLHLAAERGYCGLEPVLPGFTITSTSTTRGKDGAVRSETIKTTRSPAEQPDYAVPDGFRMHKATLQVAGGKVERMWPRIREDGWSLERTVETIKGAFIDFEGIAVPVPPPATAIGTLLNLIPLNDIHVGMFAWARETALNWDLKISENTIGTAVVDLIERAPAADTAVILGGGDLTHADNNDNETARSGNKLDVDGRHQKIVETACRLVVLAIDIALRRHNQVIVRVLRGNHDDETAVSIAWFLHAWYRNEPRVIIDLDQSLFWEFVWGKVMLAATHGHEAKITDLPGIMAAYWPADWGNTLFRYAHGFHVHHKSGGRTSDTLNSVVWETHEAPIPPDGWHYGAGFASPRSLQCITYDADRGEVGRTRSTIFVPMEEAA